MGGAAAKLAAAVWGASALAMLAGAPAQAALTFEPCEGSNQYACAHLAVPLDPGGTAPGTVTLALHRHRAPVGQATSAVVALAGGPGQAALPFTEEFTALLGPILATRDLIVFDQRGTGDSGALSCRALRAPRSRSLAEVVSQCARELGPARSFYTSADSVADIEAIREAGGYEKLVLYGTSYGTKVAELYAEEHPSHVEALVLDSVVTPNGPDPLLRSTFQAVPRVLRSLCARRACAHVTRNPVADLRRLIRRTHGGVLHGRFVNSHGRGRTVSIRQIELKLFDFLLAGDFSPLLRAELVTDVRAAAEHDDAPLVRLLKRGEAGVEASESNAFDVPLYFATTCEEQQFPWEPGATPRARLAEAHAAIAALPSASTLPFSKETLFQASSLEECSAWPVTASPPPAIEAHLPNVPTLILSGAEDLRTPTANARAVAAQIPDAHLLVVPQTGHSVLTAEPTECAHEALLALFDGKPIKQCHAVRLPLLLRPPPLPPVRLVSVPATRGYPGLTGHTLHGVALTLSAVEREVVIQFDEAFESSDSLPTSLRSGGLRAGWERYSQGTIFFHRYSYVPGLTVTGTIGTDGVVLHIAGAAAAHGTLRAAPDHHLVGELGGEPIDVGAHRLGLPAEALASSAGEDFGPFARTLRRGPRLGASPGLPTGTGWRRPWGTAWDAAR